ncbi:MAG: exodeoxyribonuclease III [Prevotellaceae bacterium]|jgi:exodeoxyribonuclease-3|nr:exodeoxyribonuclease III [Prevotellaceae bacterium]
MKFVSLNLNGIRAAAGKGLTEWIEAENPDTICFQEIKAVPEQIDTAAFENLGYSCFWYPAAKKGYSGTAILSRVQPEFVSKGMGVDLFDAEGRLIRADFADFTLVNAYFPSGSSGDLRQSVKMEFLDSIVLYLDKLKQDRPHIILTGDFNICHKPIDINFPEKHVKMSGFLPEEREWFDRFVASGWVDTFRVFCSEPEQYSWWSYRGGARSKNLGWRIDYFMVTESLRNRLAGAGIRNKVVMSDHCPVVMELVVSG